MNSKLYILPLAAIVLMPFFVAGQSLRAYERKAMEAYEAKDFAAALAYNQVLLEVDSLRVDALFMGAESARQLRVFDLAERLFLRIPDASKTGLYSLADFRLANAQKGLGKYNEAALSYQKFLHSRADTSQVFQLRAAEEIEFCESALERLASPTKIVVTHLDSNVNTVHSDFAPLKFADKLYFTSAFLKDTASAPVNRIFSAIQDDPALPISENPDDPGLHASHISFTADGRRMFYTICQEKGAPNAFSCEIFYRNRNYEGYWEAPKRLPDLLNQEGYTATHPSVGRDAGLKREVLFFASDRPGGQGGMDIWGSVIELDGSFGRPFPLPFNTPLDEITPFFHQQSQVLFFSSNGLDNMGGLDVFHTKKTASGQWATPENMGYPLNSSYDDLYYTFHSGSKRAYFASNRPGCLCADPTKACKCNDIYEAQVFVDLAAWVFNAVDSTALQGARVELTDLATGQVDTFEVQANGNKSLFPLDLEKNYRITASLRGFQPDTATVSTMGVNYFAMFERLLYLQPRVHLLVRTFNAIDSLPLHATTLNLRRLDGKKEDFHKNAETENQHIFLLDFGKTYHLEGSKPSYSSDGASVATLGMNRTDTLFEDLYLSPFPGLPLVLYFDNDKPRWKLPMDTTTLLSYEQTLWDYMERKDVFVEGYSAGLDGEDMASAQLRIRSFLENEVMANYQQLQQFCGLLSNYLQEGHSIEIVVEGYASPLAKPDYNKRLGGRRISSLTNHFKKWSNGALNKYFVSGQLAIVRAPKGEEGPPEDYKDVSDDVLDRRQSEYSPAASKLRRVTIREIRLQRQPAKRLSQLRQKTELPKTGNP